MMDTVQVMAGVTLSRAARRVSTYTMLGLSLLPAVLCGALGYADLGGIAVAGPLALRVLGPLLVAALVAGPVGEALEHRTVVYPFTRPVSRAAVVLGEFLGMAVVAGLMLGIAGGFLAIANALVANGDLGSLWRIPLALGLEGVVLAGFSTGVALLFPRHPLVATVGLLTLTEGALSVAPGALQHASLTTHIGHLARVASEAQDAGGGGAAPTSAAVTALVLAAYGLGPLAVGARVVQDRDLT
ncbi:MAG: ABC transporter permease [Deltaproteobacteria bacterium]|nr:ABC transporter permease [Deltaproteobacteria bacterium]